MKLYGKLITGTNIIRDVTIELNDSNMAFRDALEKCLIDLCKELDIQVPLWLKKNTKELGAYRRTFFPKEQFLEKVWFDKFEIRLE